jgi:hypothetical protein
MEYGIMTERQIVEFETEKFIDNLAPDGVFKVTK